MSETKKSDKTPDPSFEKSLEELEAIVKKMEGGELGLDQMIEHFEKGSELVKTCSRKLNEVERRIEKLVKDGQGGITAVPLEP